MLDRTKFPVHPPQMEKTSFAYTQANRMCLVGASAAWLAAGWTLFSTSLRIVHNDPTANAGYFVDSLLLAILGLGVWKQSRIAAVLLSAYWLASKAVQFPLFANSLSFWLIGVSFLVAIWTGLVGAWIIHRKRLG